jgi:hypothetical protein
MKPKKSKPPTGATAREERTQDGRTRPAGAPLDKDAAESYNEVQPERFKGDARSSIEAAVADPDVDDTIGGE